MYLFLTTRLCISPYRPNSLGVLASQQTQIIYWNSLDTTELLHFVFNVVCCDMFYLGDLKDQAVVQKPPGQNDGVT